MYDRRKIFIFSIIIIVTAIMLETGVSLYPLTTRELITPSQAQSICQVGNATGHDTSQIQSAIDQCQGGGEVLLTAGQTYTSGTLELTGGVTLNLNQARINGSNNLSDYSAGGDGEPALIMANSASQVGIQGPGTIFRPVFDTWVKAVIFHQSSNIIVKDINIESPDDGSLGFHLVALRSNHVLFDGVVIRGNTDTCTNDGIDIINSQNVTVINTDVAVGDDVIAIATRNHPESNQSVLVKDTTLATPLRWCSHGAIKFGSGCSQDMRHMCFNHVVLRDSNIGIGITPRTDVCTISDLTFLDMIIQADVDQPFYQVFPYIGNDLGPVHDITYENVTIYRDDTTQGDHQSYIQNMDNVIFENVTYNYSGSISPSDTLIEFYNINGLCINNFRIIYNGVEISDPINYLNIDSTVSGLTIDQDCGFSLPAICGSLQPQLTLTKSSNLSQASPGQDIRYTIHYSNTGQTTAQNVVITDHIPQNTSYIQDSANPPASLSAGVLSWSLGSLNIGQQGDLEFRVTVD